MVTLTEYEDFISRRLSGLGVSQEVAGFALQQVEADIRTHIAKPLHLIDDRLPDLAVLKPTTIDQAIQWHKHHRLNGIFEQFISPPAERATENTLTRFVDRATPLVQAGLRASPVATIYRHIPPQQRIHRGQISEEAIVTAILTGFKHGLQQQLGEVADSVLNRVMSDRHTRDPGVVTVGVLIGVAWAGWDMTLDSLDAVRDYAELAYSIYQMDIPREFSEAWQNLLQILQEPLPPDLQGELEGLAYNAGLELGRNTGRDFVNEISLIYRAAPAIPWLRNLWPSIVLGRILAPVIIATLEIALEFVPGGQAVGVVALATRLLRSGRLARRLPGRQLLQRLLAWLRRLRNRPNLPRQRQTRAIHGGTPSMPSRTTRRSALGSRTQAAPPTPARSSAQPVTQARGTRDRGDRARTTQAPSSQETPRARSTRVSVAERGITQQTRRPPRARRFGTGSQTQPIHDRGRRYRGLTGETARMNGIRKISGGIVDNDEVEIVISGTIRDPIESADPRFENRDVAPNFQEDLPRPVEVGLPGYERAHLWGPGFGDEARDGIMYAPERLNQVWQNQGVEKRIRHMHELISRQGGRIDVVARARSFPLHQGVRHGGRRYLILKEVEYEVAVWLPGRGNRQRAFLVSVEIDHPTTGSRVHSPDITPGPAWDWLFSR